MKYLDELIKDVSIISSSGDLHIEITGIQLDSRKIEEKNCFVAIRGFNENGLRYLGDALGKGANSVIFEASPEDTFPDIPIGIVCIQVENARVALGKMAAGFYGYNKWADEIYGIGITGTNGKTTVMSLIHAIFSKEYKTAKIGTLGMEGADYYRESTLTTPEAADIFKFLAEVHQKGCNHLVMEVSSVGLDLHRVEQIRFSQGIFTNFSGDHLDFHQTMEEYFSSKLMLFNQLTMEDWAIINIDDPAAIRIIEQLDCKYLTYGFSEDADIRPLKYKLTMKGIQATLDTPMGKININSMLLGRVNLINIMAAVCSAIIREISTEHIVSALREFKAVRGRLDIAYQGEFSVLIDYAHTDKALEGLLLSLKEIVPNKIILVFGAGGSRDRSKRPRMGSVASQHADFIVVSSDNPRNEDPIDIINDIIKGFKKGYKNYKVEPDRKKAIEKALKLANKDDLVVIAGKGHEDYQIFKDNVLHFDDYEVLKDLIKNMEKVK